MSTRHIAACLCGASSVDLHIIYTCATSVVIYRTFLLEKTFVSNVDSPFLMLLAPLKKNLLIVLLPAGPSLVVYTL